MRSLPLWLCVYCSAVAILFSLVSAPARANAWVPLVSNTTENLYGVYFVSAQEGWAVGGTLNTSSVILHTVDGGKNWTRQSIGSTDRLRGVYFPDRLHGYAVGDFGLFAYTSTGGDVWNYRRVSDYTGYHPTLYSIKMLDPWTGWVAAVDGDVYKTSNAGASFNQLTTGNTSIQMSVDFADANTGVVVGNFGRIYYTTSGGDLWDAVDPSPVSTHLRGVDLVSARNGFAVGDAGAILRTQDGGATWAKLTSGTTTNLNGLYMADASAGVAVGNGGLILTTANGGAAWAPQTSNTTSTLRAVHGADAGHVFAVGDKGVILASAGSGGGTVGDVDTDGDCDMADVAMVLRIRCGGHKPSLANIASGDLDSDGALTWRDAMGVCRLAHPM